MKTFSVRTLYSHTKLDFGGYRFVYEERITTWNAEDFGAAFVEAFFIAGEDFDD